MAKCTAKTSAGEPCKMQALKGSKYCFTHAPEVGAARAMARKAGGARHRLPHAGNNASIPARIRSIEEAMTILDYTLAEIIPMENSIQRGRLLIALCAGFVDALKVGEIEARLLAIENALKAREVTR